MRKKVRMLTAVIMCALIALAATSFAAFAVEDTGDEPSQAVSTWNAELNNSTSHTVNDDGTLTVSTVGKNNPFNQSAYMHLSAHNLASYDDISVSFNLKVTAENGADQPLTFNYGIAGGGQFNMTFYWQGGAWTNAVCGGQNFTGTTATMKLYKGADTVLAEVGPNTAFGFDSFIANFSACGLKNIADVNGHDVTVRETKTGGGTLIRIYYDSLTCDDAKLFYSLDLVADSANGIENSFLGVNLWETEYTLSNATVSSLNKTEPDPGPGPDDPDPIVGDWQGINASESTTFDFGAWETDKTVKINDKDATTEAFFKPQAIVKLSDLYDGEVSAESDYAVYTTVKIDGIGNKYSAETQIYFYWYADNAHYYGNGFQYGSMWTNAFVYATNGGAGFNTVAKNGNGQYAGGLSNNIANTALPLAGLLTGSAGRERTFVTVFSVIENKGIYARVYLKGDGDVDFDNDTPIYQSMISIDDTSDYAVDKAYFGLRIFNADATVSGINAVAVTKNNEGLTTGATVTGDMGIWKVNDSLPAAVYTAENGVITMDDSLSSAASHGIAGISASLEDLAGDKEYLDEKDVVIGFNLKFLPADRETELWFGIIDGNENYISVGMFRQYYNMAYVWTNSCVLSNSGNPISGYVYEKFGKTTSEFENERYNYCGVMAIPSVAKFNAWDSADGHGFYMRYTAEGERLVIRVYYDYGSGVNFYTDEEVYKVVIYDYPHTDFANLSFGIRALGAKATLSNVTFENFSTLHAAGKTDEPTPGGDDDNNDNNGGNNGGGQQTPADNRGCGCKSCGSQVGAASVVLSAAVAALAVALTFIRRKKLGGKQ